MTQTRKRNNKNGEMSFLEHLEELRWHLIRSALAILVLTILAFLNKRILFDEIILHPAMPDFWTNRMFAKLASLTGASSLNINQNPIQLISIKMSGQFMTHCWVSIVAGIIIAFPYILFELWRFISPALYEKERRYSAGAVWYSSILFFMGVLFGYFLIAPLSVNFLGNYSISSKVINQINILSYINTITSIVLAGGIVFELPILIYFLSKTGLVTPEFMRKYRRHMYVVLLIVSAIITPPDIFSQILVCCPLVMLYEIGIVISKRVVAKKNKDLDTI